MNQTMDLFAAHEAGQTGMQRAADHADRVEPGWTETALEMFRREVRIRSDEFTVEQIRANISAALPTPPDLRSWGSVTQSAIKRGVIVKTGSYAPAASSNGSPKALYRRGAGA